jgi:Flp pilus assembly protein TadD
VLVVTLGLCACTALQERASQGDPEPAGERTTGSQRSADKISIPPEVQLSHDRAVALMRAERYREAVEVLKTLVTGGHGFPGPYLNLGIAYLALGEDKPAQEALARAIELDPASPVAYNQMGILQRRAGRFQEAREAYQKALAVHPEYANAHLNLGILCDLYLQNRDCALEHYQRYQALSGGEDKQVSLWLADLSKRRDAKGK